MLPVCMFSGLTIWQWTTNRCALPWGGSPTLPTPNFTQLPVILWVELRAPGLVSIEFGMFIGVSLLSSYLGRHVGEISEV